MLLYHVLKCLLEENRGGLVIKITCLAIVFPSSPALAQTQMMSNGCLCVLCVKELSLCAPHLKIDVDSTQKMM